MIELILNTPFSFVVSGPVGASTLDDATVFFHGSNSGLPVTTSQITANVWSFSFTPPATGVYALYAFGEVKAYAQCVLKPASTMLTNIEDSLLGSWNWDKSTGILTTLRQNGSLLTTHQMTDTSAQSSKERS